MNLIKRPEHMNEETLSRFVAGLRIAIDDTELTDIAFSEGVCSNVTLSNILRKEQRPSDTMRKKLAKKLNMAVEDIVTLGGGITQKSEQQNNLIENTTLDRDKSPLEHLSNVVTVLDEASGKISKTVGYLAECCQAVETRNKELNEEIDRLSDGMDELLYLKHLRKTALEQVNCIIFVYDISKKLVICTNPFPDATKDDLIDLYTVNAYAHNKFKEGFLALEYVLGVYKSQKTVNFQLVTIETNQTFEYRCVPLFYDGDFIGVFVEATEVTGG